jgi:signal transduction histidine kinase
VKKADRIRMISLPIAFIAIVLFALLMPGNTRFVSAADIAFVEITAQGGASARLETADEVSAFIAWLARTVPREELCFVRETDAYGIDAAEVQMVAEQTPDGMSGIDETVSFAYSIYRMYVSLAGDDLYYNGVHYDLAPADAAAAYELFLP